jgi:peptidoglycan hydrolase CwlO-like protein
MWEIVLGAVLFIALLIPITAILVDSPLGRSFARRMDGQVEAQPTNVKELQRKVDLLEADVEEMKSLLSATRDEVQFVQKLLEKPKG